MKKIILTLLCFFSVSVFVLLETSCSRDIDSAMKAYNSGDYKAAYKELLPLAKSGNYIAQNNLGNLYANGLGIKQDYNRQFTGIINQFSKVILL